MIDASSLANSLGQSALSLATELQSLPQEKQMGLLKHRQRQLSVDAIKLIEVAAVELVDDVKYHRAPPQIFTELSHLSLGYSEEESGQKRGIPKSTVKSRRKDIKAYMGTRTRNDTVAEAIHQGFVHIEVDDAGIKPLSWMEDRVLAFAASGWTTKEIADYFSLSDNTIDRHYEEIRTKLQAKNMPHAVRRGFEVGIFRVGEPISISKELIEELTVYIAGPEGTPISVKISDPREIDLLEKMVVVGNGSITARQVIEADGSYEEGKAPHVGRTVLTLNQKLEQTAGKPIIVKSRLRIDGNKTHLYRLTSRIDVKNGKKLVSIPEFVPPQPLVKGGRPKVARIPTKKTLKPKPITSRPRPQKVDEEPKHEAVVEAPQAKTNKIVSRVELPPLNKKLLDSLGSRDPSEVRDNLDIQEASDHIAGQHLFDDGTKVVLFLRYGLDMTYPRKINRGGQSISIADIEAFIPKHQGLDVVSASLVCGLSPLVILKTEAGFIAEFKQRFPALEKLETKINDQIKAIELGFGKK